MKTLVTLFAIIALAACSGVGGGLGGGSRTDLYESYETSGPITGFASDAIQTRQAEFINAVRIEKGARPLQLNAQLTAAALTHAKDIARQNRAWNFGSDRSTPQTRAERAGFSGVVVGEAVAETFQGELIVVRNWLSESLTNRALTDPRATDIGVAYFMESSGKVWWVTVVGEAGGTFRKAVRN